MNVIELRNLRKQYGSFHAVDGLDVSVQQGDIYGFLGPNGAGKSTSIRMMLSLIQPTSGEVFLFGKPLREHRSEVLRRIGAIVERPDFYNYLTAYKNLELVGRLAKADVSRAAIMRILGVVGLDDRWNSKVKTFSHGMKQRLGIAQTLLHNPDLIILDEPTTGLDPQGMVDVRELILSLSHEHKKTVFLSSHILPEVELTATRMIIINKGKAIVEGNVQELLNAGRLKLTIETPDHERAYTILGESAFGKHIQSRTETGLVMMLEKGEIPVVSGILTDNGIRLSALIPTRSLEEYFINLTHGAA